MGRRGADPPKDWKDHPAQDAPYPSKCSRSPSVSNVHPSIVAGRIQGEIETTASWRSWSEVAKYVSTSTAVELRPVVTMGAVYRFASLDERTNR